MLLCADNFSDQNGARIPGWLELDQLFQKLPVAGLFATNERSGFIFCVLRSFLCDEFFFTFAKVPRK
jgi:hypothetical protein